MKISTNSLTSFTPIDLSIRIDSEDELEALFKLSLYDFSVPELVYDTKHSAYSAMTGRQKILSDFLTNLAEEIRKVRP